MAFAGFKAFDIATTGTTIHGCTAGSGPPVLLLHGIPETHLMWRDVAPRLAEHHTVVATDLRGYGDSGKPPSTPDHEPYSMRSIGRDQLEVMRHLGYDRFAVVGHDRGARCAYRLALDHPEAVERLAVLDIVPVGAAYARADRAFTMAYWQWAFLGAPEPVPERYLAAAPGVLVDYMTTAWTEVSDAIPAGVRAEYAAKLADPATAHAICEEFRAAQTIDVRHDDEDRARGRTIQAPVLFLWGARGAVAQLYPDPLAIWREFAGDVRGEPVPVGHFIPEEAPQDTAHRLLEFLR
ncbi:alpha/beta fold hydrolase [Dactylosporangium sp. CS-047395]|uniref:alpha/beta fold hydrolase n=1 Tax=Dactylosporangium sp. CS-047395 TaxID=3239936 RepID=UPI003D9220EB